MERIIILPNIPSDKILAQEIDDDLEFGVIIVYCEDLVVGSVIPLQYGNYRLFTIDLDSDYECLADLIEANYNNYTFKYITNG